MGKKKSLVSPAAAAAAPVLLESVDEPSSSQASAAVPPPLLSSVSETQVLTSAPTQNQVAEGDAVEVTKAAERAIKVLDKARKAIVNRELETLKSILPLTDNYPVRVLGVLIDELNRNASRTNPLLYIGLSSVLQRAFIDCEVRNKIGQASILNLLNNIVGSFNESVMLTGGDQTIPYLALDTLNLCLMNLKKLGTNPLPRTVHKKLKAKLKESKPTSSDISDVIKMQQEYAENMLQSIDVDMGTFDKVSPYLVPVAKVGLGLGLVMSGIGAIALTGSAAQGVKSVTSGVTMTFAGGWAIYQQIPKEKSSWYPRTLMTYSLLATIKEEKEGTQQENDFKTLLEAMRKESHLNYYDVGLLGIIYHLVQLYPEVSQPVKQEIIDTLAAIAEKSDLKPFLRKNAMLALKYIIDNYKDSPEAVTQYERCLSTFNNKKKLTKAIAKQYSFFCILSTFMGNISEQFSNAKPTLFEEVLEDEKIREGQLEQDTKQKSSSSTLLFGTSASLHPNAKSKAEFNMPPSAFNTFLGAGQQVQQTEHRNNENNNRPTGHQTTAFYAAIATHEGAIAEVKYNIYDKNHASDTTNNRFSPSQDFFKNEEITVESVGSLFRVKINYTRLKLSLAERDSLQLILRSNDGEEAFAYEAGTSVVKSKCITQLDFNEEEAASELVKVLYNEISTYKQPAASAAAAPAKEETSSPKQ